MADIPNEFAAFHYLNRHVYRVLVALARQWVSLTGRGKLGIGALYERARWELAVTTMDPDYKLNNNFRAYYARMIMAFEPDLDGMFDLRSSDADEWLDEFIQQGGRP